MNSQEVAVPVWSRRLSKVTDNPHNTQTETSSPGWRNDAARIVEELFPVTSPSEWDALIDLRRELLLGRDWPKVLDLFLTIRCRLESEHYLPFYRLRRLLATGLRLEIVSDATCPEDRQQLATLLRRKHRSLEHLQRSVRRELFEAGMDLADRPLFQLRLIEN